MTIKNKKYYDSDSDSDYKYESQSTSPSNSPKNRYKRKYNNQGYSNIRYKKRTYNTIRNNIEKRLLEDIYYRKLSRKEKKKNIRY